MLILSKKKDYYDGVVGIDGIDKTIVYDRKTSIIDKKENFPEFLEECFNNFSYLDCLKIDKKYKGYDCFIIGFCGKLYIGWRFYCDYYEKQFDIFYYDFEHIKSFLNKKEKYNINKLKGLYDKVNSYNSSDIFRQINAPVFVFDANIVEKVGTSVFYLNKKKFIINPNLSEYKFYRIFDSFKAFQEIEMYISGVLGNKEKETVEVDDKYKIQSHGFDKFSFRKEKSCKKL